MPRAPRLTAKQVLAWTPAQFRAADERTLRRAVQALADAGNKRLKDFERKGEKGPAYSYIMNPGRDSRVGSRRGLGRFSTKGKDFHELQSEFVRARNFMQSETGTVAGWRKTKKSIIKALQKSGVSINSENFDDVWEAYQDLKDLDPSVSERDLKYKTLDAIAVELTDTDKSPEAISIQIKARIADIYKEQKKKQDARAGVSDAFTPRRP